MGVPGAQNRPRKGACEQIRSTQLRAAVDAPSSALDGVEGIGGLRGGLVEAKAEKQWERIARCFCSTNILIPYRSHCRTSAAFGHGEGIAFRIIPVSFQSPHLPKLDLADLNCSNPLSTYQSLISTSGKISYLSTGQSG